MIVTTGKKVVGKFLFFGWRNIEKGTRGWTFYVIEDAATEDECGLKDADEDDFFKAKESIRDLLLSWEK
jgi:hypothetical protein